VTSPKSMPTMSDRTSRFPESEARFAFGKNWTAFRASINDARIGKSCQAIKDDRGCNRSVLALTSNHG